MSGNKTPDYCCWPSRSKWFDVGYDLLTLANDCLADTPLGVPSEMFMDLEEPDFNCCDFISVHPQVIRPIQPKKGAFPEENFQPQNPKCGTGLYWVPRYEITIGRPCRPLLSNKSSRPIPASAKERTEFTRKVMHDAETLPCCITEKIYNGYPLAGIEFQKQEVFPQQMYIETFGPCVRMRFRIMFDFESCCTPDNLGYNDPDWGTRSKGIGPLGDTLNKLPSACMIGAAKAGELGVSA